MVNKSAQILFQTGVQILCLAVGLRMVGSGEGSLYSQALGQVLLEFGYELGSPVGDD